MQNDFFCSLSVADRLIPVDIHFINTMSRFVNTGPQNYLLNLIIYHGTYKMLQTNVQPILNKIKNFGKTLNSSQLATTQTTDTTLFFQILLTFNLHSIYF